MMMKNIAKYKDPASPVIAARSIGQDYNLYRSPISALLSPRETEKEENKHESAR